MDTMTIALYIAIVVSLYMAWNIGANDVANAFGTSVGSKAITISIAVLIAAVFEFAGAVLVGGRVTETISKGIIDIHMFDGHEHLFMWGMISALVGAAIWINVATFFGWPVSTTHAIVGSVVGAGIVAGFWIGGNGLQMVSWGQLIPIVMSWIVSPLAGAVLAYFVFLLVQKTFYQSNTPSENLRKYTPYLVFSVVLILALSVVYKGLKNVEMDISFPVVMLISVGFGLLAAWIAKILVDRYISKAGTNLAIKTQFEQIETVFKYLQILTACYVAFAHGANDVANAVGPLAGIVSVIETGVISAKSTVPMWALILGGAGIVLGLATYGYKVIDTIGKKITELTPTRGFSAEFGTATTVLVCSLMGLPISTTHTLVGAVIGVGFARGMANINGKIIRDILASWFITIPFAMALTAITFYIFLFIFNP
ncbi:MAG: inorganic phosphate transporter [Bacteroidetes bacterium]|nr:inorganic phosphate transporter [Bacteroidota bacterium]